MTTWNGKRIKDLRKRLGLTQEELAAEIGTRQQTISHWETEDYLPRGIPQKILSIMEEKTLYGVESKE